MRPHRHEPGYLATNYDVQQLCPGAKDQSHVWTPAIDERESRVAEALGVPRGASRWSAPSSEVEARLNSMGLRRGEEPFTVVCKACGVLRAPDTQSLQCDKVKHALYYERLEKEGSD